MVTAHGSIDSVVAAMKEGADDYLLKPLHRDELLLVVERLLDHARIVVSHERMLGAEKDRHSFQNISSIAPSMAPALTAPSTLPPAMI